MGDFVCISDPAMPSHTNTNIPITEQLIVRIDYIFVHIDRKEKRIFAVVSHAKQTQEKDSVLRLPYLEVPVNVKGKVNRIIGLPLIKSTRVYAVPFNTESNNTMIAFNDDGKGKEYLLVDWPIRFL